MSYNNVGLTPLGAIIVAYLFLLMASVLLFSMGFFSDNEYFRWGVPVVIFGKTVNEQWKFYVLMVIFFCNQLVNSLVTEIVYSWIVNCVQDPKSKTTYYSKSTSIVLVLANSLYFSTNMMLMINANYSQISFFLSNMVANLLAVGLIDKRFIDRIFRNQYTPLLLIK